LTTRRTGWILRSETQAVFQRRSRSVFMGGSDIFLRVEKRLYKLFKEIPSLHFRLPGMDRFLYQDVGAVKKDVMVQATAVCHCG
jgi:hypothetical protein